MPADPKVKDLGPWLEAARDEALALALDQLVTVPDRAQLGLGFYPSKGTFERACSARFFARLPDTSGLVFPYTSRHVPGFATVRELESDTHLGPGRAYVYGRGRDRDHRTGLFGGHRLDVKRPFVVLTDDEWRVCTDPAAVACLQLCPETLRRLTFSTRQVRLASDDVTWLVHMAQLVAEGFHVVAPDERVQADIAKRIVALLKSTRSREAIASEVRSLLSVLPPLEQVTLLQWLEKELGVPLRSWLVPVPEGWDEQGAFIGQLDAALAEAVAEVRHAQQLVVHPRDGAPVPLPALPEAFAGWWLQQRGGCDLVDWAYNSLGALPAVWLRGGHADRFELNDRLTALLWQRLWKMTRFHHV
jgi:hypothetical protein